VPGRITLPGTFFLPFDRPFAERMRDADLANARAK
jgi:hypothetical protein